MMSEGTKSHKQVFTCTPRETKGQGTGFCRLSVAVGVFLGAPHPRKGGCPLTDLGFVTFSRLPTAPSGQGLKASSHTVSSADIRSAVPFDTQSGLSTLPEPSLGCDRLTQRTKMAQCQFLSPGDKSRATPAKAITRSGDRRS